MRRPTGALARSEPAPLLARQIASDPRSPGSEALVVAVALRPVATVDRPCTPSSRSRPPSRRASRDQCAGGRSMRRPTRRADSLLVRLSGPWSDDPDRPTRGGVNRNARGLPCPADSPSSTSRRVAELPHPGALAEIVLPGALAELPRGGLALFPPLAGGVNDGGFPKFAGVAAPAEVRSSARRGAPTPVTSIRCRRVRFQSGQQPSGPAVRASGRARRAAPRRTDLVVAALPDAKRLTMRERLPRRAPSPAGPAGPAAPGVCALPVPDSASSGAADTRSSPRRARPASPRATGRESPAIRRTA